MERRNFPSRRSALSSYGHFVEVIDRAAANCDIYAVPAEAEAMGIDGAREARGLGERWEYRYDDGEGATVLVHARWWDQSKAFAPAPDMHVMSVTLTGTETRTYERRYET